VTSLKSANVDSGFGWRCSLGAELTTTVLAVLYTLISAQHVPLAEYTEHSGTMRAYACNMHRHIDPQQRYGAVRVRRQFVFYYLNGDGLTFLCLCAGDVSADLAFGYLNEVYMQFFTVFGDADVVASLRDSALPFELSKAMRAPLRLVNRKYVALHTSHDEEQLLIAAPGADRAPLVLDEATLKAEMKCALLVHENKQSRLYRSTSQRAPPAILAKYPFLMVGMCIALSALVFVYIVVAIGCGAAFQRCIVAAGGGDTHSGTATTLAATAMTMATTTPTTH
jgi:hypothetical protein